MASTNVKAQSENVFAKIAKIDIVDNAYTECIYEYTVKDPILKETRTYNDILQIGKNKSKYFNYKSFRIDSIVYKKDINKITKIEYATIYKNNFQYEGSPFTIIKDKTSNIITYYDKIFTDYYIITDSFNIIKWKLINETKFICGYKCQMAEADFRGRKWIAFYTPNIPINDGPWKFSGLPGLILRIEDANKEHIFNAITIRKSNSDIYIKNGSYSKASRNQFNEQLNRYKLNPGKILYGSQLSPKDHLGNEKTIQGRKLFYNPIELK